MGDELDAKVLARRQKDLAGFTEEYEKLVNYRALKFGDKIAPIWKRTAQRLDKELRVLLLQYSNPDGTLSEAKLKTMGYKIANMDKLRQSILNNLGETVAPVTEGLGNGLGYEYARAYNYAAYGLEQAAQVAISVPQVTAAQVMGVVNNPWLPDGKNYSDRIRQNTQYLADKMYNSIGRGVTEGWDVNKTAREIQRVAGEGYFNSVRLARTEFTRAASQGASQLYVENSDVLDGKRWNATLDSRTAARDAKNDGLTYRLEYDTPESPGKPGERIPNHPHCRCRWTPILSALGISTKERIARATDDTPNNLGARTYTKARTYEEYAKQRGLPDLNERLASEKPTTYLRAGESFSAQVGKVYVPPTGVQEMLPFTPASNLEEAAEYAKNFAETVDYSNFDVQTANVINEELYKFYTEYDAGKLISLDSNVKGMGVNATYSGNSDPICQGILSISGSVRKEGKLQQLYDAMKRGELAGYVETPTDALRNIIQHEMGHAVFRSNMSDPELIKAIKKIKLAQTKAVNDFKRKYAFDTISAARLRLDAKTLVEFENTFLSTYSETNLNEWVSEAFTTYYAGGKNRYAEEVVNAIRSHVPVKKVRVPTQRVAPVPEITPASTYVPLNDVKKATAWARDNLPIDYINYKGYAPQLADEVNATFQQLYERFPEMKGRTKWVGTAQERNRQYLARRVEESVKAYIEAYKGKQLPHSVEVYTKAATKRLKPSPINGHHIAESTNKSWGAEEGITFNEKFAKDYKLLSDTKKSDVAAGWKPVGTGIPSATVSHEFGHQIDNLIVEKGLRDGIEKLWTKWRKEIRAADRPATFIRDTLSGYADTNSQEFVAEGFSEYIHNPNPRPIAKEIGQAIEKAFENIRAAEKANKAYLKSPEYLEKLKRRGLD